MISMTGYGYAERNDERYAAAVEVKSYNNRYLDINCTIPGFLSMLEARVREAVSAACRRGRVDVYIRFREMTDDASVAVDGSVVAGYLQAYAELKRLASIDEPVTLSHLLAAEGVMRSERTVDSDAAWAVIGPLLDEALGEFSQSRAAEGARLETDIREHLAIIGTCVDEFERHAGEIEQSIRTNLRQRFAEVLGSDVDENRILSEVAVQLTRFSINEEIVRLRTHMDSFREICNSPGPVGKKLDFVSQELNREINTTGSKSIIVEVNQRVVEAKDALENVREQLRNVE